MTADLERLRNTWETWAQRDRQFAILSGDQVRGWDESRFMSYTWELDRAIALASATREFRFGRALDFGCGIGRLSQPLAGRFQSVVGLDISSEMIANAGRLNRCGNCEYLVGTVEQLPSAEFDFVMAIYVIQHIPKGLQAETLRALLRVLKPDGVAVAVIYSGRTGVRGVLQRVFQRVAPEPLKEWRWRRRFPTLPRIEMNPLSHHEVETIVAPAKVLLEQDQWYVMARR
jgi:ubiquinone/menaquinone biosynthesis C-methylase UbiE